MIDYITMALGVTGIIAGLWYSKRLNNLTNKKGGDSPRPDKSRFLA